MSHADAMGKLERFDSAEEVEQIRISYRVLGGIVRVTMTPWLSAKDVPSHCLPLQRLIFSFPFIYISLLLHLLK